MRRREVELTGWGRVLKARAHLARPEKERALLAALADAPGPALGNGRSYGDAGLRAGAGILSTRLDRIIAFDAERGEATVEPGTTIATLLAHLAPRGWMPAVMPGTGFATVGGCIANDVHGKNHHVAGTFGAHVSEIVLGLPDGSTRVTRPGEALFAATCGGLGQTGVILRATLRLAPCSSRLIQVDERRAPDLATFLQLLRESRATFCVGWIDGTARGSALGRGILEEAELTRSAMAPRRRPARRVPFDAPAFAISPPVVRAFNRAYYARGPASGRGVLRSLEDFFFPLDKIHDWNRLYGKRGFHQFQCVLPDATAEPVLREMLTEISRAALCSPLAVLKRTGPGRAGPLSFPMEGYTLALDFPNTPAALPLLQRLNAMTLEAGGRIYFAKDSTATPEQAHAMYPERSAWAEEAARVDPDRHLETELVRRLRLRAP